MVVAEPSKSTLTTIVELTAGGINEEWFGVGSLQDNQTRARFYSILPLPHNQ